MPKFVNIEADADSPKTRTVEVIQEEFDAAEKEYEQLRDERIEKRNSLSKTEFRKYNDETQERQAKTQKRRDTLERELSRALGRTNQTVVAKKATEKGKASK